MVNFMYLEVSTGRAVDKLLSIHFMNVISILRAAKRIFSNGKKVILYVYKNEYSLLNEKTDTRLISIGKNKIPKNQLKSIY